MNYEFEYDPEPQPRRFLCVTDIIGVPDPIPQEFTYIVCIPEDGLLYFHSGYYTFDAADSVAAMMNGVTIKINLKGIIDSEEEENGKTEERSSAET